MAAAQAEAHGRLGPSDAAFEHQLECGVPMQLALTHGVQLTVCRQRPSLGKRESPAPPGHTLIESFK